jgi:phage N-6-adenine-methyltransferase
MTVVVQTQTPTDEKDEWRTPPALFAQLAAEYGPFDLDAAATADNALCRLWLGPGSPLGTDALAPDLHWQTAFGVGGLPLRVFCNPPYSRGMVGQFVAKAYDEVRRGFVRSATLLLPATTDVTWWHTCVWHGERQRFRRGVEVEFLRPRVRFLRPDGTPAGTPTFGSVAVTFYGA